MKLRKIFLSISFLTIISCYSQNKTNQEFLYYFDSTQDNMKLYTERNNVIKIKYIDEHAFATGKYLGFDKIKLEKTLIGLFPNKNSTGYCYIDLESPYIDALINEETTSKKFKESLNYYIKIINESKKIRPNVRWGYYGIPLTTYWDIDKGFYQKQNRLKPLFDVCDIFFPSMYFFYSDNGPEWTSMNEKFVRKNTQELIMLAKKYKKPVFPFVMERYHPSNPHNLGMKKIPEPEFLKYLKIILNESVGGNKVDGIVWWNADKYYFQTTLRYEKGLQDSIKQNNDSNLKLMKKINEIIH